MDGWISIHRKIRDHWIWQDANKLKWWLEILLSVNHFDTKVNIGMELYTCKRGQSIMSLSSWGERFGCKKDTARNFFKLLEKDGMILHESIGKSTRITVCNYDSYQPDLHDEQKTSRSNVEAKQKQRRSNTNTNNNDNNIINNNIYSSLSDEREHETEIVEEKPKKKTQGKKKDVDPYFAPLKECFMNFYSMLFNSEYYWEAKDSVAIKAIFKKLQKAAKDKNLEDTPENIATNFGILLTNITDKWILDRLSPNLINAKYNEIVSNIKNTKKHGRNSENITISFAPVSGAGTNEAGQSRIDAEAAAIEEWCRQNGLH